MKKEARNLFKYDKDLRVSICNSLDELDCDSEDEFLAAGPGILQTIKDSSLHLRSLGTHIQTKGESRDYKVLTNLILPALIRELKKVVKSWPAPHFQRQASEPSNPWRCQMGKNSVHCLDKITHLIHGMAV